MYELKRYEEAHEAYSKVRAFVAARARTHTKPLSCAQSAAAAAAAAAAARRQAYSFEPKPDFKAKADEAERMWKKDLSKVRRRSPVRSARGRRARLQAGLAKAEGNTFFKNGDISKAVEAYTRCVLGARSGRRRSVPTLTPPPATTQRHRRVHGQRGGAQSGALQQPRALLGATVRRARAHTHASPADVVLTVDRRRYEPKKVVDDCTRCLEVRDAPGRVSLHALSAPARAHAHTHADAQIEPNNIKALLRRATASESLEKTRGALNGALTRDTRTPHALTRVRARRQIFSRL